jgi:phosphoribosyl-dephospho-CoA transferase
LLLEGANAMILVETPHQLLVNKLCALLSRSELRDLVDVRVLIESGLDLTRALADCPARMPGSRH